MRRGRGRAGTAGKAASVFVKVEVEGIADVCDTEGGTGNRSEPLKAKVS